MKRAHVKMAVLNLVTADSPKALWDERLRNALPVLKLIASQTSWSRFWIRAALAIVVGAIEAYLEAE